MPSDVVNSHASEKDWHVVVFRCPDDHKYRAEPGNSLFPSKMEASVYAKAATKADGKRRLVAKVVRRYRRQPVTMVRDDYEGR